MKTIIILFLSFCVLQSFSQTSIDVAGTLADNTTWNIDTVVITDDVIVPKDKTLTIEPGVVVLGAHLKSIYIYGSLIADGEKLDPIKFSAIDTLGFYTDMMTTGSWGGINFINLNDHALSSIMNHCIVEYGAAYSSDSLYYGGGIFIDNSSSLTIKNSIIQNNKAYRGGAGIYMYNKSSPHIVGNLIKNNKTLRHGGGISVDSGPGVSLDFDKCAPVIEKNIIIGNVAFEQIVDDIGVTSIGAGGGIYISTYSKDHHSLVYQNVICNNRSLSGAFYESSWGTKFVSNIVSNNSGVAVFNGHGKSESVYLNNTITNNINTGPLTFVSYSKNLNVINNIIYNNWYENYEGGELVPNDFQFDKTPLGKYRNNTIKGLDQIPGTLHVNNFDYEPQFVSPTTEIGLKGQGYLADWSLIKGDSNIDNGYINNTVQALLPELDVYGNDRIYGSTIDIGAVEYKSPMSVSEHTKEHQKYIEIYPNPFTSIVWVNNISKKPMQLFVYNEAGQCLAKHTIFPETPTQLNTEKYASGMYFIEGTDKGNSRLFVKKVLKVE